MNKFVGLSGLALGALLLQQGVVSAQVDSGSEAAGQASETEASDGAPSGQPLSMEAALQEARATLLSIEQASDNIARMLSNARRDKDAVKIICLDRKLDEINVTLRAASDRVDGMAAAVAAGSEDRVEHDGAVIGALGERADSISAEANQCIGEEKGAIAGGSLKVVVDPDIPSQDTADIPSLNVISTPPTAASPTF